MTDPIVRFVSAPSPDADVRFDFHLNNSDAGGERRTSDRQSWSWQPGALLGDADGIGSDFGLGQISFTHMVMGSRTDALRAMGVLSRELRRDENYLLFQLDEASPAMWLKTYKASAGALTFPYIDPDAPDGDVWLLDVSLPTESTSMGERESFTVTIANDPAAENGLAVVLPEIKGDAPAPLVIEVVNDDPETVILPRISVAPYIDEWPGLQFWQAEDLDLLNGTEAAPSGYSGGGSAFVDFGFSGMLPRVAGSVTPAFAGRWRLFARVNAQSLGGIAAVKGGGAALVASVSTEVGTEIASTVVELGEYVFPKGNPPSSRGYSLAPEGEDFTVDVRLVSSGTGPTPFYIDYIVAWPIDGIDLAAEVRSFHVVGSPTLAEGRHRFNGEAGAYEALNADGDYVPRGVVSLRGDFPQVVPGATNVLQATMGRQTPPDGYDQIYETADLSISYQPRYVWLPSD